MRGSGTTLDFEGVWGSGGTDVFAVGQGGTILHYDGTSWSAQPSGTTENVLRVWGSGVTDVCAVGFGGTILHYGVITLIITFMGATHVFGSGWRGMCKNVYVFGAKMMTSDCR